MHLQPCRTYRTPLLGPQLSILDPFMHAGTRFAVVQCIFMALKRSSPYAWDSCGLRRTLRANGEDRSLGLVIGNGVRQGRFNCSTCQAQAVHYRHVHILDSVVAGSLHIGISKYHCRREGGRPPQH
jgi:hypothetical protein